MSTFSYRLRVAALGLWLSTYNALADSQVSPSILNPQSAAEAWNVLRLATHNVELLVKEHRLREVPVQMSYCSPALRALSPMATEPEKFSALETQVARAFISLNAIVAAAQEENAVGAESALVNFRKVLATSAQQFDAMTVSADIFVCPMHPDVLSESAKTSCPKCGMQLITRRIPYSFIYTKPGEPSARLAAIANAPLEAGKRVEVKVRLETADKKPVTQQDLLVMHTQPIHLLIEDPGLSDYHHEHPVPTDTPGEYSFSFTPKLTSPYRIWADIVPAATGVQELPFVDLPSKGESAAIAVTANLFTSRVDGYQFTLGLSSGNTVPIRVGQIRNMSITVTDPNGKPVTSLAPVMNAFAHLVGFYDDYRTVIHLHPGGGDVLDSGQRGGPTLTFTLFAPQPGFIRLYCQVNLGGQMLFAPFNLNVEP